jgi:hypothetical protein
MSSVNKPACPSTRRGNANSKEMFH